MSITTYSRYLLGGSFNTLLDALDGSYCTFEGGDDPLYDPVYPDPTGYNRTSAYRSRAVLTSSIGLIKAKIVALSNPPTSSRPLTLITRLTSHRPMLNDSVPSA